MSTYKVSLQFTRVPSIEVELRIARVHQILHKCRARRQSLYGVLLLEAVGLALVMMIVDVMSLVDSDGASTGAVASSNGRCVGNRGSVTFAHVEIKKEVNRECEVICIREEEFNGWMRVGRSSMQRV